MFRGGIESSGVLARGAKKKAGSLATASREGSLAVLGDDPAKRLLRHVGEHQQVLAAVVVGGFPLLALAVTPLERGVETHALLGRVGPDGGANPIHTDFVCGLVGFGGRFGGLFAHVVLSF